MAFAQMKTAACVLSICLAAPANSANITEIGIIDTGAAERVEAAAMLQVLSQEAASAACHMANDVNVDEATQLMKEAKVKFTMLLDALEFGNADMGIAEAEQRKKTVLKINDLRANWQPMYNAAVSLLENPKDKAAIGLIKADNEAILMQAYTLTSDLEAQYANPAELMQSDAMLLEFAARQAVLTQKMAKISCEIWAGNRSDDRLETLTKSMSTYELTLDALLNGMPAVGLEAAPTPSIKEALQEATAAWKKTKAELTAVVADEGVNEELKGMLFHDLNLAMRDMQKIEHLYVLMSKHGEDMKEADS